MFVVMFICLRSGSVSCNSVADLALNICSGVIVYECVLGLGISLMFVYGCD